MKNVSLFLCGALLLGAGCGPNPPVEYKLSAEQIAWQPYKTGDQLRFGQAHTSKVRTFTITEVKVQFHEYSVGGNAMVYLGPPKKIKAQELDVYARRTDTLRYVRTPTSTPAQPDSVPDLSSSTLISMGANEYRSITYLNWDIGFGSSLPLDQKLPENQLADTTRQLLPNLRLSDIDYGPVWRIYNELSFLPTVHPRARPARLVYFAKGYGVVGFVEGNTLWYRLP
ncbi:hypothetical protein PK28_13375 [Hymenobacter sp. DG25B]|uniref:hypothetical protein n=1 Tax=Hymenobacter sp. DG25B TaxID=1385664 RepID=UPI000540C8D5|nr:hypothetical protein [Hymenobacter sp. DG25B]AIZ64421.1 hypothetical protein PK28_13375 [Hymenobacter sp. DG25B]